MVVGIVVISELCGLRVCVEFRTGSFHSLGILKNVTFGQPKLCASGVLLKINLGHFLDALESSVFKTMFLYLNNYPQVLAGKVIFTYLSFLRWDQW